MDVQEKHSLLVGSSDHFMTTTAGQVQGMEVVYLL